MAEPRDGWSYAEAERLLARFIEEWNESSRQAGN